MDTSTMTFEEILFHGRYHIIGAILFVVFFAVFIQETVRELLALRSRRREMAGAHDGGPMFADPRLGITMADGGEKVEPRDECKDES